MKLTFVKDLFTILNVSKTTKNFKYSTRADNKNINFITQEQKNTVIK